MYCASENGITHNVLSRKSSLPERHSLPLLARDTSLYAKEEETHG